MFLKNLTLLGFKSFPDKTSLNFLPGVSAIVGPNGCGKSNLADAIRWVLGEQSARALRGGEMADVIFSGTDQRKPVSMAEVSLTIGEVDGENLRAAGVDIDYNEVTVTRRVFRDGASEYFLNRAPCRLKDIQQLFMGTGVGRTSYSIMAQGNITQIISSKPEDRRSVFEEAAGITKYKAQKREALRKLEYTEQNLLRVSDLVREVKRQIGSLQRQAGKARRYKQLMLQLQHLDTQLARHQFDVLLAEIRGREASLETIKGQIESCTHQILSGEEEINALRHQLAECEQDMRAQEQRGHEIGSQVDRLQARVQFNHERLREIEAQNAKALADITQGEERRLAAEQELSSVQERLAQSSTSLDQHREALRTRQAALQALDRELAAQQELSRQVQQQAFDAAQRATRLRNSLTALDLQKQGNVVRLEKLSAEKIQLEEERSRLEARLDEFAANVEAEKQNVQTSRGTLEDRQALLRRTQQELQGATERLDALLHQQAERRSQLSVLERLQADYEGFGAGALAVLKGTSGVIGSLTDRMRVPDRFIAAVEAALGFHLQLALTDQPSAALEIVSRLNSNRAGRASIAALALLGEPASSSPAPAPVAAEHPNEASPSAAEVAATGEHWRVPALSVIEADRSIRTLLQRMLESTYIVQDLASATAAWKENPGRWSFVTLNGEILDAFGIFTGGSGQASERAPGSALGRKNQIAELREASGRLQEAIVEASRLKGGLQSECTALQAGLQQAQTDLRLQEVAIATRQGEVNALQVSLRSLHQKIDTVVYEIQSLAAQEQEALERRAGLSGELTELERQEQALKLQITEANSALEQRRQQRESATASVTECRIALAAEEQLHASFQQQKRAAESRVSELAQLVAQRRAEVSSFLDRRAQCETEIHECRQKVEGLELTRQEVNRRLAALLSEKHGQEEVIAGREDQLRNDRRSLAEAQEQRASVELELAQRNMAVDNLRQRIREKYQVNLDDVRSECITITFADQGSPTVQTMSPEEMAASGAATDWNAVGEQVAALQKRIDEMGPVNLVAIEEYEEAEQRYQFLSKQSDDLVKAKEQLLELINRVNRQTREMFTETFARIRENFQTLFQEVFGGGKADLFLVDEGDVLESGVEIVARPPGKQLQSISLLSGGEQTMTAVALLFAIYQVKPSPFCVLDELDAPLDESNINRFIRVLQRFLSQSQFVIITHNKRTIGMADVLYGITMPEQGVSKIVSVKFHKTQEGHHPAEAVHLDRPVESSVEEEEERLVPTGEALEMAGAR